MALTAASVGADAAVVDFAADLDRPSNRFSNPASP
jgi:hypothetical protein